MHPIRQVNVGSQPLGTAQVEVEWYSSPFEQWHNLYTAAACVVSVLWSEAGVSVLSSVQASPSGRQGTTVTQVTEFLFPHNWQVPKNGKSFSPVTFLKMVQWFWRQYQTIIGSLDLIESVLSKGVATRIRASCIYTLSVQYFISLSFSDSWFMNLWTKLTIWVINRNEIWI